MSTVLTKLNHIANSPNNSNAIIRATLIVLSLAVGSILYQFLFQTFTLLISTSVGALSAFYFFRYKFKAQEKAKNMNSLLTTKYIITLYLSCNEKFSAQRKITNAMDSLPWDSLINFYDFQSLPHINLENLSFLLHQGDQMLFKQSLELHSQITTLCLALTKLQNTHQIYLEKINNWDAKVKTMKGLREMQSSDLKILKEKIGANLLNYLMYLTQLIEESSNSIHCNGLLLLNRIESYKNGVKDYANLNKV